MPYSDLPPYDTFWRCPACGSESKFQASGTGSIACDKCGKASSVEQLLAEHTRAHPPAPTPPAPTPPAPTPPAATPPAATPPAA